MNNLNDMQQIAVSTKSEVVICIAGAGSGKTTVLTKKIAHYYDQGHEAESILAITFTNKAAAEMRERLLLDVGPYASLSWVMTFHAFAVRIIRDNVQMLKNYQNNFLIVDEEDKKAMIKRFIKAEGWEEKYKAIDCIYAISKAKSFAVSTEEVEYKLDFEYIDIFKKYSSYLIENNAMDFDDLLLYAHKLLKNKSIQAKYHQKFKAILVDEFQDTSAIQFEILNLLKSTTNNLFVVGDADQSIYGWRGAQYGNLLNLINKYKDVEVIKLEQNYRSTKNILDVANKLINFNDNHFDKALWTDNEKGAEISFTQFESMSLESHFVASEINNQLNFGIEPSEVAVLYRSNYQSRKIEEALIRKNIPYQIYGGIRFYERMEIKDILAYIRLIINKHDEVSLNRVINVPKRKIGLKTIEKYYHYKADNQVSLFKAIADIGTSKAQEFIQIINKYQSIIFDDFKNNFDQLLIDIGYQEYLLNIEDEQKVQDRMDNINELKESIIKALAEGRELQEYLNELTLFNIDNSNNQDMVILSTIHGVKGLEFDSVYMIGMVEGRFPSNRALEESSEVEEERRLAYVGITRARKNLKLTAFLFDFNGVMLSYSQFIEQMGLENKRDDWQDFII